MSNSISLIGTDLTGQIRNINTTNKIPAGGEYGLIVRESRLPIYTYTIPSTVHVAAANAVLWDLWNADATKIIRVVSIKQKPDVAIAVTGIVFNFLLERTTAIGTGGTAQTAWLADLSQTALSASVTFRLKPSGGATASIDLLPFSINSEETNPATIDLATVGGLELVNEGLRAQNGGQGIVLRNGQGIRLVQVTNSAAGNSFWDVGVTQEAV